MELDGLTTKFVGRNVVFFEEVDSTQLEAWRNKDLVSGSIVIADVQTSGKGTHGRVWQKNCANDIAFSLKVNLNCDVNKLKNITFEIAKIIVDEFERLYNVKLDIKLPNDIMKNNRKIGGILTETKVNGNIVKDMVIGIGINLCRQDFSDELQTIATSIENETNIKIDRVMIISEFCNGFEKLLESI